MLAVDALSGGAQAVFFFIAFVAFIVAGILAVVPVKNYWAALVSFGLAAATFVWFWNALALS